MLKFYILISKDPGRLWRHFSPDYSALPKEHTEVVINTTNKQDERDLVQFCNDFDISYTVTKSNGTPGKGKNSVLEIFSKSSYDYCVQIDGDDLLTPHGVELYQQIAESGSAPDAICLINQVVMTPKDIFSSKNSRPTKFFKATAQQIDFQELYKAIVDDGISEETAENYVKYKKEFHRLADRYVEGDETHCRVVFFSKKAAEYKFSESTVIGEDTLQYYELKNAHMLGHLNVLCNDESPATYIYYQHTESTVSIETKGYTKLDWLDNFNTEVKNLETQNKLWEQDLPLLEIEYTTPPCMEDYKSAGPVGYVKDNRVVALPANASMSCVKRLWKEYSTPIEK